MACVDITDDLSKLGHYYLEEGYRGRDWLAKLKEDVPSISEGDANRVYANVQAFHAEQAAAAKGTLQRTPTALTVEQFAKNQSLGWRGTADMIARLAHPDGSNPIWDKVVAGKDLTPAEHTEMARAIVDAQRAKAEGKSVSDQVDEGHSILHQFDAAMKDYRKSQRVRTAGQRSVMTPEKSALNYLSRKYGPDAAQNIKSELGNDLFGKLIGNKQRTPAESDKIAQVLSREASYKPPTPAEDATAKLEAAQMRKSARDAVAHEIASSRTAHNVLEEWADQKDAKGQPHVATEKKAQFMADIAKIAPTDFGKLAGIMSKYTKKSIGASFFDIWRAGLISNPLIVPKVVLSQFGHFAANELGRGGGTLLDRQIARYTGRLSTAPPSANDFIRATAQGATKGLKGAGTILKEGDFGLHMRGQQIGGDRANIIPTDSANPFVRGVGKMHSAAYYPGKVANYARAIAEEAYVEAHNMARAGQIHPSNVPDMIERLKADPTERMKEAANKAAEGNTFLNKNAVTEAMSRAKAVNPLIRGAIDSFAPIARVPTNIIARNIEYTTGIPHALGELAYRIARREEIPQEVQKSIVERFGRGTVGAAAFAAGMVAKALWPQAVTSPNNKSFDKGSLHLGHDYLSTGNIAPSMTPFEIGVLAQEARMGNDRAKTLLGDFGYSEFADLPGAESTNNFWESLGDGEKFKTWLAKQAASYVPASGAVHALANYTDKDTLGGEHYRKARPGHPLDYIAKGIPGLREHLPLGTEGGSGSGRGRGRGRAPRR